jgi:hypothetical protein
VELYLHSPIRLHGVVLRGSTETTLPLPFSGAHPASYRMGTGGSFTGSKAAGA